MYCVLPCVVQDSCISVYLQDDFYEIRMPLPEILKQKLVENAQAVADKKVMVQIKTSREDFDL